MANNPGARPVLFMSMIAGYCDLRIAPETELQEQGLAPEGSRILKMEILHERTRRLMLDELSAVLRPFSASAARRSAKAIAMLTSQDGFVKTVPPGCYRRWSRRHQEGINDG